MFSRIFYYKTYFLGNSINADNGHVLITLNGKLVKFGGEFSGFEDVDNDGIKDFLFTKSYRVNIIQSQSTQKSCLNWLMVIFSNALIEYR